MGHRRELKLASELENLHLVERFVEEISDEYYLNDNYYGNILIAVTEAFKNAVIHGNRNTSSKSVNIVAESVPEGIRITVRDQGEGFSHGDFTDPEKLLGQEELKGKGLLLILTLSDGIEFKDGGKGIEMLFSISGVDEGVQDRRSQLMKGYFSPADKKVKSEGSGGDLAEK